MDPESSQVETAAVLGAQAVELHTGRYALARGEQQENELAKLTAAGKLTHASGLALHAGHGLNYRNVQAVASIPEMHELNIGHSIVARAVFIGLQQAVHEMKQLCC